MAYEEKQRTRPHSVTLDERERLTVTGVDEVERFDPDEVVLLTARGSLCVRGSDLHISRLSLDGGDLAVDGLVTELVYEESAPSGSLWSRLLS